MLRFADGQLFCANCKRFLKEHEVLYDEDEIDTGLAEWEADFRRGAGPPSDESEDGGDDEED